MTARLSPQREAVIVERAEAATPGPWSSTVIDAEITSLSAGGHSVRDSVRVCWMRNVSPADAEFIAHAPDDVKALAAELAAVRAELSEAQLRVDEDERRYTFDTADLRRDVDHHKGGKERWRKRALEAEAMVRELKRPAELKRRAETRSSFTALISEAEQAKDHEGAAHLAQELAKVEAKWQRDDENTKSATSRDELKQRLARAIYALKSPAPSGSEHYRSGWDNGLEASIDAARTALDGETRS